MYFFTTPPVIRKMYPDGTVWEMDSNEKTLWLTFDDGPVPEVTPIVLELLKEYNAKATFFCVGNNVEKHPSVFEMIIKDGHSVGNHTFNHKNGWKTITKEYLEDVEKCDSRVNSKLFRPPYGKLKLSQLRRLKQKYTVVMWSVLSGDFDINQEKEKCLEIVINYARNGSIICFHDSLKAKDKMLYVLPGLLGKFSQQGYAFKAIPMV